MQMLESKEKVAPETVPPTTAPMTESTEKGSVDTSTVSENTPHSPGDLTKAVQPLPNPVDSVPTVNIGVTLREEGESALIVASSIEEDGPVLGPRSVSRTDIGSAVLQLFGEFLPILKAHLAKPKPVPAAIQKPSPAVKPLRSQTKKQTVVPQVPPSFVGSAPQQPNAAVTQGAFTF